MPFIVIFNIIVSAVLAVGLVVILVTFVLGRDLRKKQGEKVEHQTRIISKVRAISYLVIFAVMLIMIVVNLIV